MPSETPSPSELGERLAAGDRTAAPAALNLLETRTARVPSAELVSAAGNGTGHVVGVTGPPGVGKSTLLSALLREWRTRGRSVAVLAVDPSSKRSGGALLGDRARIEHDPADRDIFIRSMAAGERLGGLAPATRAAAQVLANAFDVVVIETVGVGQSETDVAEAADTVAVIVQPGSGDALQFLKAGIMEIPDVLVVTKADLGPVADRAQHDLRAALGALGARATPVLAVSSLPPGEGIDTLADALDGAPRRPRPRCHPDPGAPTRRARRLPARARRARPARARRPPSRTEVARGAASRTRRAGAAAPPRVAHFLTAPCVYACVRAMCARDRRPERASECLMGRTAACAFIAATLALSGSPSVASAQTPVVEPPATPDTSGAVASAIEPVTQSAAPAVDAAASTAAAPAPASAEPAQPATAAPPVTPEPVRTATAPAPAAPEPARTATAPAPATPEPADTAIAPATPGPAPTAVADEPVPTLEPSAPAAAANAGRTAVPVEPAAAPVGEAVRAASDAASAAPEPPTTIASSAVDTVATEATQRPVIDEAAGSATVETIKTRVTSAVDGSPTDVVAPPASETLTAPVASVLTPVTAATDSLTPPVTSALAAATDSITAPVTSALAPVRDVASPTAETLTAPVTSAVTPLTRVATPAAEALTSGVTPTVAPLATGAGRTDDTLTAPLTPAVTPDSGLGSTSTADRANPRPTTAPETRRAVTRSPVAGNGVRDVAATSTDVGGTPGVAAPAAAIASTSPSPALVPAATLPAHRAADAIPLGPSSTPHSLAATRNPDTDATPPSLVAGGPRTSTARPQSLPQRPPAASPSPLVAVATLDRAPPGAVTSGIAAAAGSSPPPAAFRMLAAVVLALTALLTPLLWLAPLARPIPYLSLIERPG